MSLRVNGHSLRISQLGPDFLFLAEPIDHQPAKGTIVMRVDEKERHWEVGLPHGISAQSVRVELGSAEPGA